MIDLLLVVNAPEEQGHGMHEKCVWKDTKFRLRSKGRTTRYKIKFMNCLQPSDIYFYMFICQFFSNCILVFVNKIVCMLPSWATVYKKIKVISIQSPRPIFNEKVALFEFVKFDLVNLSKLGRTQKSCGKQSIFFFLPWLKIFL